MLAPRHHPKQLARVAVVALATWHLLAGAAEPAPEPSSLVARAEALMRAGQPSAAYVLLAPAEATWAGTPQFDYLLGIAAIDSQHPVRAILALERVVTIQPWNSLARAELARANLAAGDIAAAQRQLKIARQGRIPPEAAHTIDGVLALIESRRPAQRHREVRAHAEIGVGYDTNVNSATADGQIALPAFPGLSFDLDPASRQRGTVVTTVGTNADLLLELDKTWHFTGAFSARQSLHQRYHELQQGTVDVSAGLTRIDAHTLAAVQLFGSEFWLDGTRYRSMAGVNARWQRALSPATHASVFTQWAQLAYSGQPERDSRRLVAGAGGAWARGTDGASPLTLHASAFATNDHALSAEAQRFSHHDLGGRFGVEWQQGRVVWWSAVQFERRRYGAPEPFFDVQRVERQRDVFAGVRYAWTGGWAIHPQVGHIHSASNVPIYDYHRTLVQVVLRRTLD